MNKIEKIYDRIISFTAIILCFFHLYTGLFGLMPSPQQRSTHLGLALILVFLLVTISGKKQKKLSLFSFSFWLDLFFIISIILSTVYVFFDFRKFLPIMMIPPNYFEIFLAIILIVAVLEAGRRTIGWVFPILTFFCLMYALLGQYIPGKFGHPVFSFIRILKVLYFSTSGIFGFLTGLSATYIALFVIFGTVLLECGGGKTFIDIAMIFAGRLIGGPAKVAVIASAFFSMLSGSPMANAATTGNFTIPMMKKLGYSPEFAASVESVASSGGVLTPPIMGAAAFLMADFLGIPYLKVCIAAAFPAFLFYLTTFMGVHFEAVKLNLLPIPTEELPKIKDILSYSKLSCLFIPIFVLLYTLIKGYSLTFVGSSACSAGIISYVFSSFSLEEIKIRIKKIPFILEAGGKSLITIVPILVCANIVLCLLDFTGLTIKFSSMVMRLGESNLFMSLLLTGILVMILGTGLPTTAAYILGVLVSQPMLEAWGVRPIAGHLFILYYSNLATITPPVCPTVFVASAIAKSNWLKTAWGAIKLAPLLYILPFLFIYDNTLVLIGDLKYILLNVCTAIIGSIVLISGTMGQLTIKCNFLERIILVSSGVFLLISSLKMDILGFVFFSIVLFSQILRKKYFLLKK